MPRKPVRVVAITGASGGIGSALARAYAAPDIVLGLFGRDRGRLEAVALDCRKKGAAAEVRIADITDETAISEKLTAFDEAHPVDLFFANAGVTAGRSGDDRLEPWHRARAAVEINLLANMQTIAWMAERMAKRGRGQIAVMGSLGAWRGLPSSPAYSASKAGIETYGMALRAGMANIGVGVTVISPGFVDTEMCGKLSGARPLIVNADRAASIIKKHLPRNPPRISFPFPLNLGVWMLARLPDWLARQILPAFAYTVHHD